MNSPIVKKISNTSMLFILIALFVLAFAMPALAGEMQATITNSTIYSKADYSLTITPSEGLTSGDTLTVDFPQGTDLSELNEVKLDTNILETTAYGVSGSDITITLPEDIAEAQEFNLVFKGIINTSFADNYNLILEKNWTEIARDGISITMPTVSMFSDEANNPMVNIRQKISLKLVDDEGNAFNSRQDTLFMLDTYQGYGAFYPAPADKKEIDSIILPAGQNMIDFYYSPQTAGINEIIASNSVFSARLTLQISQAKAVKYAIWTQWNQLVVNQATPITVYYERRDQHHNTVPNTEAVTINVESDFYDKSGSENTILLFAADENGKCSDQPCTSVTIPPGENSALFYFLDTRPTSDAYWAIVKLGIGKDDIRWYYMDVNPGPSARVVMELNDQNTKLAGQPFALDVYLQDAYGNRTDVQPYDLTVNLESTSPTGCFYAYPNAYVENRISQVSFPRQSGGESVWAGLYLEASSDNDYIVSEAWDVPANKIIDSVYVKYNAEAGCDYVYLQGWNVDGWYTFWSSTGSSLNRLVNVPHQYTKIRLCLRTDESNLLYPTYISMDMVNFYLDPAVQTVYYMDTAAGKSDLSAVTTGLTSLGTSVATVSAPDKIQLVPENNTWPVNHRGKVTIKLQQANGDPYVVPTALQDGVMVWLETNMNGTWWDAMINGNQLQQSYFDECYPMAAVVAGGGSSGGGSGGGGCDTSTIQVWIPAGASSLDLWYCPSDAGEHELFAWISNYYYCSDDSLCADTIITASQGDAVKVVFNQRSFQGVAGKPVPVTALLLDQYNNPVAAPYDVTLDMFSFIQYQNEDGLSDRQIGSGHYYLALNNDGTPDEERLTDQITILKGSDSTSFYYYDQVATYGNAAEMGMGSMEFDLSKVPVYIQPGQPYAVTAKVFDFNYYGIDVARSDGGTYHMETEGSGEQLSNLLIGRSYPVKISIVDQFGNAGAQTASTTVDLPMVPAPLYGKFYSEQYHDLNSGRISQITINANEYERWIWFAATGAGEGTIQAKTTGLQPGNFAITTRDLSQLVFYFPDYDRETDHTGWFTGNAEVQAGDRIPIIIQLADAAGNRLFGFKNDIAVNLEGDCFYATKESDQPISKLTIPAGLGGILLYVQAPGSGNGITLKATSPGLSPASASLALRDDPLWTMPLNRGWNALSIPVALGKTSLNDIIQDTSGIAGVFYWNGTQWLQIYQDAASGEWYVNAGDGATSDALCELEPMNALYIKMKGANKAQFWASPYRTGPYTRALKAGWNLIGPAIDLYADKLLYTNEGEVFRNDAMYADELLSSIKGKYSQVISPSLANQSAWSYVPNDKWYDTTPLMEAGKAYWIYMNTDGQLAGFSYTSGNQ